MLVSLDTGNTPRLNPKHQLPVGPLQEVQFGLAMESPNPTELVKGSSSSKILQSLLRGLPSCIIAAIIGWICFAFHVKFPFVSFIFLIIVVLQSLSGDYLSSVVVSVVAFLFLNYFFVPPILSLSVSDPSDTLALVSFLITGLVITRLTSRARASADLAASQREVTVRLYELAQELLALDPGAAIDKNLLRGFRSRFQLDAVCLFDGFTSQAHMDGESHNSLADQTRAAYIAKSNSQREGIAVRLLFNGDHILGAVGFEGLKDLLTAEPLAALATIMMERIYAFQRASHAAAATEAEVLRGALLDALAHEFKTPLATIMTATDGLKETGLLQSQQKLFVDIVGSEATRLNQLTSRLLRLARLDRDEITLQMELTDLTAVMKSMIGQYAVRWPDRRLTFIPSERVEILADQELLWLGLTQLLDNACKYSWADSEIRVSIEPKNEIIAVRIWNGGASIPSEEQARIFERFYRGPDVRNRVPGSGLGLYVARKIALAHGGNLELVEANTPEAGTAFRFTLLALTTELGDDTNTKMECPGSR